MPVTGAPLGKGLAALSKPASSAISCFAFIRLRLMMQTPDLEWRYWRTLTVSSMISMAAASPP